jgi:DNA-binding beta-propeller fold protein YncE
MRKNVYVLSPLLFVMSAALSFPQGYKLSGEIPIGGAGGWDYLTADSANRRLYVSHTSEVVVIDLDSQKVVGRIAGMSRIHGIALANGLGTGFISDGGANQVVTFNLKDLSVQKKIKTGMNPDGIVYDDASKRVFAFNGRSQDATAIDASTGAVAGTIKLGGKPEFPVSDGKGSVYVNVEDKNEIVHIDSRNLTAKEHWPISPCESPSGLAMDKTNRRLFSVCDGKVMAIVNADSGKVVATPVIGDGPDAAAFDPETKLAFSSNGDGTLTVIKEAGKDSYSVAETVKTAQGARTMALDEKTHKIYMPTANFGPAPQPTASAPHPRPAIQPGTFKILVLTK